jgi:hypothetical protein
MLVLQGSGVTRWEPFGGARYPANDRLIGQPPHPSTISWIWPVILAHLQAALWQAAPNSAGIACVGYTRRSPPPLSHYAASFCTVKSESHRHPSAAGTGTFEALKPRLCPCDYDAKTMLAPADPSAQCSPAPPQCCCTAADRSSPCNDCCGYCTNQPSNQPAQALSAQAPCR